MSTLSLTILSAKALKGGKHKVRIAVAHNSETRYLPTDVVLDSIKEWKNGMVVKRGDASYLNTKLLQRMREVQHAIDEIPYIEGLSCAELVETITQVREQKSHTLRSAFEEMMEVSLAKESTKANYRRMFKTITKVIPASTLVAHLTPLTVQRFMKKREDLSQSTMQIYLTLLAQLVKFCQRNGYVEFRVKPTDGVIKNVVAVRQNWLTPDQVRFIRDHSDKRKAVNNFCDLFMLSYYLGGINLIDLQRINFNDCSDTLHYVRTKTERNSKVNPFIEFGIPDEAKPLIQKFKKRNGKLDLYQCSSVGAIARMYRDYLGLPNLTFYSARKSFAQHAFALGESESVIDYILGHSLGSSKNQMLYSYIKVTPEMATACVRKVCDFIASSENFA